MILTVIPREQLGEVLDRFMAKLKEPLARAAFRLIRTTSADRAAGAAAERHRQTALLLARSLGMAIYPEGVECAFNWDGAAHPTPRNRPATRPKDLARSPVLRLWLRRLDVFDRPSPYRIRRAI